LYDDTTNLPKTSGELLSGRHDVYRREMPIGRLENDGNLVYGSNASIGFVSVAID
jgi:hypothetical protein